MKTMTYKYQIKLAVVLALAVMPGMYVAKAAVSFNLTAGYLRQDANTALTSAPTNSSSGALLLLIAAGGNNGTSFTAVTPANQYVSGGDTILGAASFNASFGTSGTGKITANPFSNITLPGNVAAGTYVELRWYPAITLAQYQAGATPAAGGLLGEYNPLTPDDIARSGTTGTPNTTLNPDGGSAWAVPGDGSTATLNFFTNTVTGAGGHQVDSEGYANFITGVPEPSTFVLSGLMILAAGWKLGRKRLLAA